MINKTRLRRNGAGKAAEGQVEHPGAGMEQAAEDILFSFASDPNEGNVPFLKDIPETNEREKE